MTISLTLFQWLPYTPTWMTCGDKSLLLTVMFVAMSGPVRNRIPLAGTCLAVEAWSPHACDGSLLYLTSAFGSICVLEVCKLIR